MMIVKILGIIDFVSAIVFLMFIFNINAPIQLILFCAGLLMLKGMFILTGDLLSTIDLFSSAMLILLIFTTLPSIFIWMPSLLLMAKAFASFV